MIGKNKMESEKIYRVLDYMSENNIHVKSDVKSRGGLLFPKGEINKNYLVKARVRGLEVLPDEVLMNQLKEYEKEKNLKDLSHIETETDAIFKKQKVENIFNFGKVKQKVKQYLNRIKENETTLNYIVNLRQTNPSLFSKDLSVAITSQMNGNLLIGEDEKSLETLFYSALFRDVNSRTQSINSKEVLEILEKNHKNEEKKTYEEFLKKYNERRESNYQNVSIVKGIVNYCVLEKHLNGFISKEVKETVLNYKNKEKNYFSSKIIEVSETLDDIIEKDEKKNILTSISEIKNNLNLDDWDMPLVLSSLFTLYNKEQFKSDFESLKNDEQNFFEDSLIDLRCLMLKNIYKLKSLENPSKTEKIKMKLYLKSFNNSLGKEFYELEVSEDKINLKATNEFYKLIEMGEGFSGLVHEINNLLAPARGYSELMKELNTQELFKSYINEIDTLSKNMNDMTQNFKKEYFNILSNKGLGFEKYSEQAVDYLKQLNIFSNDDSLNEEYVGNKIKNIYLTHSDKKGIFIEEMSKKFNNSLDDYISKEVSSLEQTLKNNFLNYATKSYKKELESKSLNEEEIASIGLRSVHFKNKLKYLSNDFYQKIKEIKESSKKLESIVNLEEYRSFEENIQRMEDISERMNCFFLENDFKCVYDLNKSVKKIINFYKPILEENRVKIDFKYNPNENLNSLMDHIKVEQALLNLIKNAYDVLPHDDKIITIETGIKENMVYYSVKDNGNGIPEKIKSKIFERKFTTKKDGKGTGLGLSYVKAVIDEHKGLIDFESEIGKGTKFTCYLPINKTA